MGAGKSKSDVSSKRRGQGKVEDLEAGGGAGGGSTSFVLPEYVSSSAQAATTAPAPPAAPYSAIRCARISVTDPGRLTFLQPNSRSQEAAAFASECSAWSASPSASRQLQHKYHRSKQGQGTQFTQLRRTCSAIERGVHCAECADAGHGQVPRYEPEHRHAAHVDRPGSFARQAAGGVRACLRRCFVRKMCAGGLSNAAMTARCFFTTGAAAAAAGSILRTRILNFCA
jgi:hypothetical protein